VPESHLVAAMRAADRYLSSLPSVRAERSGWRWRTAPAFFLGEGRAWTDLVPFASVDAGNPDRAFTDWAQCFWNSYQLVESDPERFTYCEGYALRATSTGVAIHHAWVLDELGQVVDTTWARGKAHEEDHEGFLTPEEGRYYFGVAVPYEVHALWIEGTRSPTLMHDGRASGRMLLEYGLDAGMEAKAYLADYTDPEWVRLMMALTAGQSEACG
jgi:hypothetical protein